LDEEQFLKQNLFDSVKFSNNAEVLAPFASFALIREVVLPSAAEEPGAIDFEWETENKNQKTKWESLEEELRNCRSRGDPAKPIAFESLVEIFASLPSVIGDRYKPGNALAKGTAPSFWSKSLNRSRWTVNFGVEIILEGHRMPFPVGWPSAPRRCDFDVSGDGVRWTVADSRTNVPHDGRPQLFPLRSECPCTRAPVRLFGVNCAGSDSLVIPEIDFKGRLREL
jgi:hypothetical protein